MALSSEDFGGKDEQSVFFLKPVPQMTLRVYQIRETKLESYRVIAVSRSKDLVGL